MYGEGFCGHTGKREVSKASGGCLLSKGGNQMLDAFEIFALEAEDQYDWIASTLSFADATKLMCEHAAKKSSTFFVYSHRTGERTYYKVVNHSEVARLLGRPSDSAVAGSARV